MFPAILRVKHRALTADGTHGAVGLHVFHCDLPRLHVHELITPLIASESLRLYIRTNLSLVSERDGWTETPGAALFKAHLLARLLLSGDLHRTMQLTKTYIEKKIEVGGARKGRKLQRPTDVLEALSTQSA